MSFYSFEYYLCDESVCHSVYLSRTSGLASEDTRKNSMLAPNDVRYLFGKMDKKYHDFSRGALLKSLARRKKVIV